MINPKNQVIKIIKKWGDSKAITFNKEDVARFNLDFGKEITIEVLSVDEKKENQGGIHEIELKSSEE